MLGAGLPRFPRHVVTTGGGLRVIPLELERQGCARC